MRSEKIIFVDPISTAFEGLNDRHEKYRKQYNHEKNYQYHRLRRPKKYQ